MLYLSYIQKRSHAAADQRVDALSVERYVMHSRESLQIGGPRVLQSYDLWSLA